MASQGGWLEVAASTWQNYGGWVDTTSTGGETTHRVTEGQREETETSGLARTTRRSDAGPKSTTTTKRVPHTETETLRTTQQKTVTSQRTTPKTPVQTRQYFADGFEFEFEIEFPNREPDDLSGGNTNQLVCPIP